MNYHAGCVAWARRVIPQYEKLAKAVHQFGCKQFVQLFACGTQGRGTMYIDHWRPLWAASRVPSVIYNETPMVMEQEQIDEILKGFGESAVNAQLAGIDGVEVHAAHSQLLGEFLIWGGERRTIAADTVILAMMRSPNDALFYDLRASFKAIHRIGDAVAPRKLEAVIYEGEKLGREI